MKQYSAIRDSLLFLGGLAGVAHETLLTHTERPTLLILFAAMMGLPAFLRSDEAKKDAPPPQPPPQPPYPYPYNPYQPGQTPGQAPLPPPSEE